MIKLAFLLALLFLVYFYKIYKDYEGDKKRFFIDVGLLLFLLAATGFSKYAIIYLPLLVLHLLLTLFAWGYYTLYLFRKVRSPFPVFVPLLSIGLFFAIGSFVSSI